MKRCLITGGTGLIGTTLAPLLTENGWEVYQTARHPQPQNGVVTIQCDFDQNWDDSLFPSQVDTIIHLAQTEYFREFPERAENIFRVNMQSTIKMLEYARRVKARSFILASSGGIYGSGQQPFAETSPISVGNEIGFYLTSKACAELMAWNYVSFMNIVTLRFFFVYGPQQRPDMLIPRLVRSVKNGTPILLYGENGIRINPIYVTDAANAVLRATELSENRKINVAGSEVLNLRDIARQIGETVGREPVFELRAADGTIKDCVAGTDLMHQLLGPPQVSFREGIRHVAQRGFTGDHEG